MSTKFYPGQLDVVEKLNQMDDAFVAGPFNGLPSTGGTLTGPVVSTSTISTIRNTASFNTADSVGRWYRVAKVDTTYMGHSCQASIRVMGTASYGATGNSNAMETVIMLRVDNDSVARGHFYTVGGLPETTVSAVRVARDGIVYVKANQYFLLQPYVDSMCSLPQGMEQADPPSDAYELLPIFCLKLGAVNTLLVKAGQVEFGARLISQHVSPHVDNAYDIGLPDAAYRTIYARTGAINTSDARLKRDFRNLSSAEIAAARDLARVIGVYRWHDAVDCKGDGAREHIGPTVQRAIEIMRSHGLNPFNYGFICHDEWAQQSIEHPSVEARPAVPASDALPETLDSHGNVVTPARMASPGFPAIEARAAYTEVTLEAGDRYAFRYDELAMFIAAGQEARLAALEAA